MFKKYSSLVISFLLGAILFSAMPIKAAIEEYILYRADYKLIINGSEFNDPDLPLMNYKGYTVGSVRKILEAAGVPIIWNAELNQAEVTTNSLVATTTLTTPIPTIKPIPEIVQPTPTPKVEFPVTTYNGMQAIEYNSNIYLILTDTYPVYKIEMQYDYSMKTLKLMKDSKTQTIDITDINNIVDYNSRTYINKTILDKFIGQ